MRFKTDENLPEDAADAFRDAGWDALSVNDQRLGGTDDATLAKICVDEERVLVTLDLGFGNIRAYPPSNRAGMIVLRTSKQDKATVLELVRRVLMSLRSRTIARELWVVDDQRIRIRS